MGRHPLKADTNRVAWVERSATRGPNQTSLPHASNFPTKRRPRGGLTLHPSATSQTAAMPMAEAMTEIVVNTKSTSFFNRSIDLPVPTSA